MVGQLLSKVIDGICTFFICRNRGQIFNGSLLSHALPSEGLPRSSDEGAPVPMVYVFPDDV